MMMLRTFRITLLAVALANAASGGASAQAPAPVANSTPAAVEQRITALRSALGITEAETAPWNAFAQAMRDNATSTEQLFQQRAGSAATMTAVDNMHSYATLARAYADDTGKLSNAFDTLYAALSPEQKQAADTLFRQQTTAAAKTAHR